MTFMKCEARSESVERVPNGKPLEVYSYGTAWDIVVMVAIYEGHDDIVLLRCIILISLLLAI